MAKIEQGIHLKVVHGTTSDIQQAGKLVLLDCRARRLTKDTLAGYTRRMRYFQA